MTYLPFTKTSRRSYDGLSLSPRTKISLVLFVITLMIFSAQTWSNFCKKLSPIKWDEYFHKKKILSNYLLRYLDVLYAEDGEDSEELPYVPEVESSNENQFKRSIHSLRIGPIVFQQP